MASSAQKEKRRAANWYIWLWVSPLFTLPTLMVLSATGIISIAILGSALWHLVLLYPALKDDSEFVRWHGRQALLLAGVRTSLPLWLGLEYGWGGVLTAMLVLIFVYFGTNLWGQRQATRGECSLMRRFGREEALIPPEPAEVPRKAMEVVPEPAVVPEEAREGELEALIDIIRYSRDPEQRRKALSKLKNLGMVESL